MCFIAIQRAQLTWSATQAHEITICASLIMGSIKTKLATLRPTKRVIVGPKLPYTLNFEILLV